MLADTGAFDGGFKVSVPNANTFYVSFCCWMSELLKGGDKSARRVGNVTSSLKFQAASGQGKRLSRIVVNASDLISRYIPQDSGVRSSLQSGKKKNMNE